jgi:Na+/melibiose symporter-like transporter
MQDLFIAVALISTISGSFKPIQDKPKEKINFTIEIKEGFAWLWSHKLLRPLAIILGSMNGVGTMVGAAFILFAQEVLHTTVLVFALLGTAGAIGGIVGGLLAPRISAKFGSGPFAVVCPSNGSCRCANNWDNKFLAGRVGSYDF